ncbi:MAG: Na-K-Cl cotransporter [marine benthic group bacterium]|nr:Na-K-Cl cotransporter [Gemmatimonadota bacterium]
MTPSFSRFSRGSTSPMDTVVGGGPPPTQEVLVSRGAGLGTFGGVFTPSILTILGVIMYLRFGWVVGNVGLTGALLIVTISTLITFLTALSISEIATDQRVRVGGAYYMISRSLGIETGGAVGIPLFFAQALSVALYTIGFAESVKNVFPQVDERLVGLLTTVAVALLALKSARAAIRAQYFIMGAIGVSLISFFLGSAVGPPDTVTVPLADVPRENFWVVFAVFFPAVTGIMAGVNMSGDLKEPGKSIPKGTMAAVLVGYAIYMILPVFLSLRADADQLIRDPLIMRRMALWGDAIILGVWGATLSSAVGSIMGAPRVLQALARDGVLPNSLRWLGKGSGPEDTPRAGTAVTLGIALAAVAMGNLNIIAPVLTMFFLTTYGVLNIAAGLERLLGSPSFRPRFKVPWYLSALGAVGCVSVMFLVNAVATVIAIVVVLGIYIWLERRELKSAWGDVRRGIWMAVTRAGLLRLRSTRDPKNWRPHILVLSGSPTRRWYLIRFANWLSHRRALVTVSSVITDASVTLDRQRTMENTIHDYLARRGIEALIRLIRAPDPFEGAERLVEAYGLGELSPNTYLVGDSEVPDHRDAYCRMIARFHEGRRNVVILHYNAELRFGRRERIDVWWGGLKSNGGLMLTLAYLLQTSVAWRGADLRVKMVVPTPEAAAGAQPNLEAIVGSMRSGATAEVLVSDGRPFVEIMKESSRGVDFILLGMREPDDGFQAYYERMRDAVEGMPTAAFVLAAEDMPFGEIVVNPEGD